MRPTTEKRFHQLKPTISPAVQKVIEKLKLNELSDKKGKNFCFFLINSFIEFKINL